MAPKARRRRILGTALAAVAAVTALAGPARADAGAACEATYQVVGVWANVHRGDIVVTNTGDATTSGWQVSWTFGNGQTLWAIWFAQATTGGTRLRSRAALALWRWRRRRVARPGGEAADLNAPEAESE
jgi:hypothetical protein